MRAQLAGGRVGAGPDVALSGTEDKEPDRDQGARRAGVGGACGEQPVPAVHRPPT